PALGRFLNIWQLPGIESASCFLSLNHNKQPTKRQVHNHAPAAGCVVTRLRPHPTHDESPNGNATHGMRHGSAMHGNVTRSATYGNMTQARNTAMHQLTRYTAPSPNEDATMSNDAPGITHPLWLGHHFPHERIPMQKPPGTGMKQMSQRRMNEQTNERRHAQEAMEKTSRETESHAPAVAGVCYIRLGVQPQCANHTPPAQINPSTHQPAQYPTPPTQQCGVLQDLVAEPHKTQTPTTNPLNDMP
ncbi:hypothetical protein BS47DRAFT_1370102, partial [Hydnum rufescens UP504]